MPSRLCLFLKACLHLTRTVRVRHHCSVRKSLVRQKRHLRLNNTHWLWCWPAWEAPETTNPTLHFTCCSLDQSEAAFGSEDFPGSRWRYQGDIVEALAERLSLHRSVCDTAHLSGVLCPKGTQPSICLLSASSARVTCPPTSIADRAQALARLCSMQPGCSSLGSIVSALKLAAVSSFLHSFLES